MQRLDFTSRDLWLIKKWAGGMGFTANVAKNVQRQGWISAKQRAVLEKGDKKNKQPYSYGYDGGNYDESDYEIGAYELCVGEWGD